MSICLKKIKKIILILCIVVTTCLCVDAQTPLASFTIDKNTGCAPLVVNFTSTSINASSFAWNFGNSNTSTIANPSTVYLNPGIYTATLIVTSINGQKDTTTQIISVVDDPLADFNATSLTACEDVNVITFNNLSQNTNTYTWDFGDGTISNVFNPTHTYLNPGTYNVRLVASNSFGCQDIESKNAYITIYAKTSANFSSNPTSACDVNTVFNFTSITGATNYSWDFGDGNNSSTQNPSHQYINSGLYNVSLITTNSNGCKDTVVKNNYISIGNALVPSFVTSDTAGCGPFAVTFTSTVSNATSWLWNFGDGTNANTNVATHTYTNPGNYDITLTVTTTSGCNGSITLPGFIIVDQPPVADFTVVQDSGCAPYTLQFSNLSSGAATYNWVFDNGQTSNLINPSTTYTLAGGFNIQLTATSVNGCNSSVTKNNYIRVLKANANFNATPRIGCPSIQVQFSWIGAQPNIISWLWNFGDGTTSNLQNPLKQYNTIGTYNVYLVVTNNFGCKDTLYRPNYIRVVSGTVAYTVPDTIPVCQGKPYAFSDPTLGSNNWLWNFGNGITSTTQNPSYVYNTPGVYTVTLATSMPGGCSQNFNPYAIINVIPYIEKPIDINVISLCKPYTANFSTTTANVNSYLWSFGDGTTSTLPNPTHIYTQAGTYYISLSMIVGAGCQTTIVDTLTFGHINPITASSNDICLGNSISFNVNSAASFTSVKWQFGDSNSSTLFNPNYTYTTTGNYTIQLETIDVNGCKDTFLLFPIKVSNPIPTFSLLSNVCINTSVQFTNNSTGAQSYLWDFGDTQTAVDSHPQHTYTTSGTYMVTLNATTNGCTKTYTQSTPVNVIQPSANFSFITDGRCIPVTATFTDLSSNAISWNWSFGDGNVSTFQNPVYSFNSTPGDSLRLSIVDIYGCTATSVQKNIEYFAANASVDNTTGCKPLTVQFTDNSTSSISWEWNFGDGNNSILQNPSHTYLADGNYTVTLVATFPGNCKDTVVFNNMISIATPIADFYSPTVSGCSPSEISFINTSTDAVSFFWDFGDGGVATNVNPSHIYYIPGDYTITLIATNSFGCSDTIVKQDYIHVPGTYATFATSTTSGCQNMEVLFNDSSINAVNWIWNFGDGFTSTSANPSHIYADTGSYTVTLITFDTLGCTSSYTYPTPIIIFQNPIADGSVTNIQGCSPLTSNFTNSSLFATSFQWLFGDGDTSSQINTSHAYLMGGIYQPQLIAITNNACRDTFNFSTSIDVWQTPIASFTVSDSVICNPGRIDFLSTSLYTVNPIYNWDLGGGVVANGFKPQNIYTVAGNYGITMIITNDFGCADTAISSILVNPSPTADATVDQFEGCQPFSINFQDNSIGATSWLWNTGNGNILTNQFDSYTYVDTGLYQTNLIVSNNVGCSDTILINPAIRVYPTPTAHFTTDLINGCMGASIQFTDSSYNLNSPIYTYTIGNIVTNDPNPFITFNIAGIYDVNLNVVNYFGCSNDYYVPSLIEIFDSIPPPADDIMSVSVVSNEEVEIIWENSSAKDLAEYRIFRLNNQTAQFDLIHTVSNPSNASTVPVSSYIDNNLNTQASTYTYRVQTVDNCGNRIFIDSLSSATTINITASQSGANINVNWTQYEGCSVSSYQLYRTQVSGGQPQLIATLPDGTFDYIDSTLSCPYEFSYQVIATDLCGNTYSSVSDTSAASPVNTLQNQQVDLTRSTVINNAEILTEWMPPTLAPNRVSAYRILRSNDETNYTHIATVPGAITTYIDNTVDVQTQEYYYRILVINDCDLAGIESGDGSSILLNANKVGQQTDLQWTPYKLWNTGVDEYVIERQKIDGSWEQIKVVTGNSTATEIPE